MNSEKIKYNFDSFIFIYFFSYFCILISSWLWPCYRDIKKNILFYNRNSHTDSWTDRSRKAKCFNRCRSNDIFCDHRCCSSFIWTSKVMYFVSRLSFLRHQSFFFNIFHVLFSLPIRYYVCDAHSVKGNHPKKQTKTKTMLYVQNLVLLYFSRQGKQQCIDTPHIERQWNRTEHNDSSKYDTFLGV